MKEEEEEKYVCSYILGKNIYNRVLSRSIIIKLVTVGLQWIKKKCWEQAKSDALLNLNYLVGI